MKVKLKFISRLFLLNICLISTVSTNAQSVSAGSLHSLFLCSDSIPRSCGSGSVGQLGHGTTATKTLPTQIVGLNQIVSISAGVGGLHSLFLKADGTVWSCGNNQNGELGDGTTINKLSPVQLPSLSNIIAISAGGAHSLFLKNDGTVWACGNNQAGQLGDGTTINKSAPIQIDSLSNVIAISAGSNHSLFLLNDGTVYICGISAFVLNNPEIISSLSNITKISAGESHSLFLKNDGTVMASGSNAYGELGDNTTNGTSATTAIATLLTDVTEIKAGSSNSFFLKNDGTVWVCGLNNAGQFGNGTNSGFTPNPNPTQIIGLTDVVALTNGRYHSVFVKNDETAQSCGGNSAGQLGNGTMVNSLSLVSVTDMCSISTTGIVEGISASSIFLSPNPSNGIFQFAMEGFPINKNCKLEIYNIQGELIYHSAITSSISDIDISKQAKGIYFVRMYDGQTANTKKIIIQ